MVNLASTLYDFFATKVIRRKYLKELDEIINPLGNLSGKRILEVGAGTCKISAEIKRRFPSATVYSTDISASHLQLGKKKADIKTIICPTEALTRKLPPDSFDLVIAVDTVHHHRNRVRAFKNIFKVLKPGGKLAMREIDRLLPGYFNYKLIDKTDWLLSKLQGFSYIDPQYFSSEELKELLLLIGFRKIRIKKLGRDALIQLYAEKPTINNSS